MIQRYHKARKNTISILLSIFVYIASCLMIRSFLDFTKILFNNKDLFIDLGIKQAIFLYY